MSGLVTSTRTVDATGDIFVDSMLVGKAWATKTITYAFPELSSNYSYSGYKEYGFNSISQAQKAAALFGMETSDGNKANDGFSVEGFTNLKFTLGNANNATIRFAQSDEPGTAEVADFPGNVLTPDSADDGDIWFGTAYAGTHNDLRAPRAGNYAWHTLLHELGHALGLKHPQETAIYGSMPDETNSIEFSIMSYRSFVGDIWSGYDYEMFGAPQTFMMADIAALQYMYGANFKVNSGNTVYRWTPDSGDTFVNGKLAIEPGDNRIFATIWDGGGTDTYDLSAYKTDLSLDLRPGGYSKFSPVQLAWLGGGPFDGYARGNIFNALLYKGDQRSLIENAKGGAGNDVIHGNQAKNVLSGNGGSDTLYGYGGNDTLNGGGGHDTLVGGAGHDTLNGGNGNDKIHGSTGNDVLNGGAGKDVLRGGAGSDKLYGGAGADQLYGGAGADRFIFKAVSESTVGAGGRDTIFDFKRGQGDKIDLGAIDANTKIGGNQAFKFIGKADFHKVAGELRYHQSNGDTFISGDVNGDGKADFSIRLDLLLAMKATDFIL
ncbi:M10 family metallopeptidase C-terminal domain-containing protein [Shinella daejeonensis]|uniref:M10 family metallopeptidase n=1 Tax=Shinella daejeonensis TaxID=659017 RepID=UPI002672F4C6|nr:M10 family metallopeptidase [Shinella daejeonensis]MCP8893445.1 M10 family metallopeptidase C-terminal domain-containing protein [Shinella daejeonensis]